MKMKWVQMNAFLLILSVVAVGLSACNSQSTPAAPAPNPYTVSGTLTYTGSLGSVSNTHRMAVELNAAASFTPKSGDQYQQNTANGAAYSLNPFSLGTYYLIAFYGAVSLPCEPLTAGQEPTPHQGDPYYFYNGTPCGTATPLTLTGAQPKVSVSISFDDTCLLGGVSGSLSYTGSHTVSATNGVVVLLYKDSGYATRDNLAYDFLTCNSTTYNLASHASSAEYLMAFLDLAGTGLPATGDPYIKFGTITPSPTLTQNLTFGDSTIY